MSIELRGITKMFGDFTALQDVQLTIATGTLVALLGPSGSGKTTLLRIIAGLEMPERGAVWFEGADVTHRRASDRRVGFVFQHYALFRHMTVFENVAFGLRVKPRRERLSEPTLAARVRELLRLVQLEPLAKRYPSQLSGGQRQRVALARALAVQPKILLLDEPFGALDARVRQELRRWLRRLHHEIGITSVFVTHDQEEALELADCVVVMREGHIEQIGSPEEVYERPATPFVYRFLGNVNLFHGRMEDGTIHVGEFTMEFPLGRPPDAPPAGMLTRDFAESGEYCVFSHPTPAMVFARPHLLEIDHQPTGQPQFRATITHLNVAGPVVKVELATQSQAVVHVELSQERYRQLQLQKGTEVFVSVKDMQVFTEDFGMLAEHVE
ncbi:MAG: sulfate/molybdate ABC transporter ATP-binding protein [Candidatus Entotheonellia bacterium]